MKYYRTTIQIPCELHDELIDIATSRDNSLSWLIRHALKEFVKKGKETANNG